MEAAGHGRGGGGLEIPVENGEKRAQTPKKTPRWHQWCSEPPHGNQTHWDSSQGQVTMKQSCSSAFRHCLHFYLILILGKISQFSWRKWQERAESHTKIHLPTNGLQNHRRGIEHIETQVKVR